MTDLPTEITEDPRYRRVHDQRERDAAEARSAQAQYLWMTRVFVIASAVAAIAGGLVLYGVEARPDDDSPKLVYWLANDGVRTVLIIAQGLSLAAAAGCGYMLGRREPGKRWITARMRAESGRLQLADRALTIGHEKGAETFRQAGDWLVAFLEKQLGHLDSSTRRHDSSAFWGMALAAMLVALAALASALTGFESKTLVVLLAIFGVAVPALTAAVEKLGEANADGKRAALHGESWAALNALRDDVPAFRAAVEAQDLEGTMDFADRVFDTLRNDHAGFAAVSGEPGIVKPVAN